MTPCIRRAEIDVAALDVARLAGVGLRRQLARRHRRHPLDRVEHRRRPDRAVHADDRRAARSSSGAKRSGGVPSSVLPSSSVVICATIGRSRDAAHRVDRRADLVQIAEGLEDEEVDAAVDERLRLLAEVVARLVDAGLAPRLDADAERPDCAGHVRARSSAACRAILAPCCVDRVQLVGEPERAELDAVGAERVGLDDVGAGANVFLVHLGHQIRLRDVQGVEALVDEDALRVQHRPHRAVADEDPLFNRLQKTHWVIG